jgi:histidine triad (HIT) family protein
MPSVFTKIINGEISAHKIAETNDFIAILDVFPLKYGHTLVIPKKEIDYIFDIESEEYMQLMNFAKTISSALKKAFPCKKVGMCVIGLEVPHAHIHLIPMNTVADMNFSTEKLKPTPEELADSAQKIISFL